MRVLIVDDMPEIRILVSMMLQRAYGPCDILACENGQEGLDALISSTAPPDLVISNLYMPNMDGLTFINNIRRNTHWDDLQIAVMSASNTPEIRGALQSNGVKVFLPKPFSYEHFKQAIDTLV